MVVLFQMFTVFGRKSLSFANTYEWRFAGGPMVVLFKVFTVFGRKSLSFANAC